MKINFLCGGEPEPGECRECIKRGENHPMTDQELVLSFIASCPGQKASTNHIRDWERERRVQGMPMADPLKRCRELYKDNRLSKHWITQQEMDEWYCKTKVMVYELSSLEKEYNKQMALADKMKQQLISRGSEVICR